MLRMFIVISLLSSCASNHRAPSSINELSLSQLIEEIQNTFVTHDLDQMDCKNSYDSLNTRLLNLINDATFLESKDQAVIDREIKATFYARIAIKEKIKDFSVQADCYKSVAAIFTGLRYVEDYLLEIRMNLTSSSPVDYVALKGEFPYLLINPKYSSDFRSFEDLKSGDIVLSRVNNYFSNGLTRIQDHNYQFSNLSFVYKDPTTLEMFTTEAHVEMGSVVAPLMSHLERLNSREAVLRYTDSGIAQLASKTILDRAKELQNDRKTIPYDIFMSYKDQEYFPILKSKNSEFMTFTPGDIQLDPRFELVAEWRNPKKMEESRIKDFILSKIFERMESESYKINANLVNDAEAKTLWSLRRLPIVKAMLAKGFPINMSAKQIQLFIALESIGDVLYKKVERASLKYERAMTPNEINTVLDGFFEQDYETFIRYQQGLGVKKPLFHLLFHP